jgi:hypothetical protein
MRLFGNIKGGGRVAGVLKLWKPEASINEKSDYRGVGLPVEVAEGFCSVGRKAGESRARAYRSANYGATVQY